MMGGGIKKDKKFISKIINQLLNGKTELNIVDDKMGTPTYTYDFEECFLTDNIATKNLLVKSFLKGAI